MRCPGCNKDKSIGMVPLCQKDGSVILAPDYRNACQEDLMNEYLK
ncbi:hypothetical protein [Bacillus sp. NPDC094106]